MLNHMSVPSVIHPHGRYIIPSLEELPYDIPMAMVYKVDKDSVPGQCLVLLCGSIGVPTGHPLAVEKGDIVSSAGLIPLLRESIGGIITRPVDESFAGIEWGGFQEPSKSYSVIPIKEPNNLLGFVVVGTNPRRPIDHDHDQFMRDMAIKIASIAASVVTAQESKKYKERLQRELESSERQIRFFAEHASVGMQNLGVDGITVVCTLLTPDIPPNSSNYSVCFFKTPSIRKLLTRRCSSGRMSNSIRSQVCRPRLKPSNTNSISPTWFSRKTCKRLVMLGIDVVMASLMWRLS